MRPNLPSAKLRLRRALLAGATVASLALATGYLLPVPTAAAGKSAEEMANSVTVLAESHRSSDCPTDKSTEENNTMTTAEILVALSSPIAALAGVLCGAYLNHLFGGRRQKLERTFGVIDQYFSIYEDISRVKHILDPQNTEQALKDASQEFVLRRTGDRLNYFARLIIDQTVNESLCENAGIINEIKIFHNSISHAQAAHQNKLGEAWRWWPDIAKLAK